MHDTRPGYKALRRGRSSIGNAAYVITTRTASHRPVLASSQNACVVIDAIRWLRRTGRIWVLGYVVMPDHVHLIMVLRGKHDLATVVRLWKGYSSREIARGPGTGAPIWQDGYYDHMIRSSKDLLNWIDYIHHNPVRKELVELAEDYQFSTASPQCAADVDAWWMV